MEGAGIWILLLLFYLLQAITKNQQKKRRIQAQGGEPEPQNQSNDDLFNRSIGDQPVEPEEVADPDPSRPQEPVSLEDLFNPAKLRDIFGVPQQKPENAPSSEPIQRKAAAQNLAKAVMRKAHSGRMSMKPVISEEVRTPEVRETVSKVASADITEVDESAADFKSSRMARSDITSDRFDERKEAPGTKQKQIALDYFDEPEDIRNAIILKEILDKPRAFRRKIR